MFDFTDQMIKASKVGREAIVRDPSSFATLLEYQDKTLEQVLNPLVSDVRARAVLAQTWGYYGLPPSKMAFYVLATGTTSYVTYGSAHILGTSQRLSQAFIDVTEKSGGVCWFNNGAKRILTAGGRVTGVIADDGTKISTNYVICNANPISVVLQMLGRDAVPSWYLNRLAAGVPAISTVNVYVGLDCDSTDLGITAHENFLNLNYDIERQYSKLVNSADFEPENVGLSAYNLADRTVSPAGTCSSMVISLANGEPWLRLKPEHYYDTKKRLAEKMLSVVDRFFPGYSQHIEVVQIATPLTNIRYTNNPGGSIYGFRENFATPYSEHLPVRGPIEGLYYASAWAWGTGGFEPSMYAGSYAANNVLRDMEHGRWETGTFDKIKQQVVRQTKVKREFKDPFAASGKVVSAIHPGHISLKVKEIISETDSSKTIRFVSADGKLPLFRAGQYINLFVKIGDVLTSRPYTIASMPGESHIDLTVRKTANGFVSDYLLNKVSKGQVFQATAPNGNFHYESLVDTDNLVFLAGGSGITPFMSMIRQADKTRASLKMHLIYGSRKPDDIIFKKELDKTAVKNPNIKADYVISEPPDNWTGHKGFLDRKVITNLVGAIQDKTFFICGPVPMYKLCEDALTSMGIPFKRIRKEVYGPLCSVTDEPDWPKSVNPCNEYVITEETSARKLKVKGTEPLMVTLERNGIVIPAVCRSGECAACRTRLLSGEVFIPARVHRRQADIHSGYIHPCMAYPLSDLRIRL
jgi:ferredoxin-NADP reductase/phytoene dehydrogenase-like protein